MAQQAVEKLPDPPEELLLPEGWKHTLPKEQHLWVSKALFTKDALGKLTLTEPLQLWWSPPGPQLLYSQPPPFPDPFFHSKLFLWMPCRMWAYRLVCTKPNCRRLGNHLRLCGVYNTVRRVLDMSGWYFIVTEYLECCSCKKKMAGWSQDILDQLDLIHREKFPAVLTYRLSCDKELVRLMQRRTPGKSATATYRHICVRHKEQWMAQAAEYLSVLSKFQDLSAVTVRVPQMMTVPSPSLLLAVYAKDALTRLGEMKARVTSIYGSILKMASTKKVTKNHDSTVWATNVGNENGQVLMCVLTQTKGEGLIPMCSGLMERYQRAGEPPPQVLYVGQDCCSTTGKSKIEAMFHEWDQLVVRLDAWQFMQRFAAGVTSESNPLYGPFMGRLFSCIFEWDAGDLKTLQEAKLHELRQSKDAKAIGKLTAKELVRHCRHQTREAQVTKQLIEQLLTDFMGATDFMGNKLVDQERMEEIWRVQQCHLLCIQDPPGIQLYRKVREVTRGGLILPLYHCARGIGSLESFHQHLNHFIPGTRTNDLYFHVYLLEGIVQWNKGRSVAVDEGSPLQHYANCLGQKFLGCELVENHSSPGEYTGELIGVEYLYSQTNRVLEVDDIMDPDAPDGSDEQLEVDLEYEDSGFDDLKSPEFLEFSLKPLQYQAVLLQSLSSGLSRSQPDPVVSSTSGPIKDEPCAADQFTPQGSSQEEDDEKCMGPDGVPGYDRVINLANSLVELRNHGFVTQRKVDEIVTLWDKLSEHDKGGVVHPAQPENKPWFTNTHTDTFVTPCIDGLKSRLVAAICLALSLIHPAGQTIAGVRVNRWAAILRDYNMIRDIIQDSAAISTRTRIQLLEINQRTLCQWYNARKQRQEQLVLHQSIDRMKASEPLLPVAHNVPEPLQHGHVGDVIQVVIGGPMPPDAPPLRADPEQRATATRLPDPKVPRTTAWRRRKAEKEAAQRGLPRKRLFEQYLCQKCGKPKTKEFGHSQFRGVHFCAKASGKTVEQWMEEMRRAK